MCSLPYFMSGKPQAQFCETFPMYLQSQYTKYTYTNHFYLQNIFPIYQIVEEKFYRGSKKEAGDRGIREVVHLRSLIDTCRDLSFTAI